MTDGDRSLNDEEGDARERRTALPHGPDLHFARIDAPEPVEEALFSVRKDRLADVGDIALAEAEGVQETQDLVETCEEGEFAIERAGAEEVFEHCRGVVSAVVPLGIGHGELVAVGQECPDKRIGRAVVVEINGGVG